MLFSLSARLQDRRCYLKSCLCNLLEPQRPIRRCPLEGISDALIVIGPDGVITPRCIPACTDELLRGLGKLAGETGCAVQTHYSESDWEHGYVLQRMGKSDATAIRDFGLMNRRTVLAHGCHTTGSDRALILDHGHVCLGTDIAGGRCRCPASADNAARPGRPTVCND